MHCGSAEAAESLTTSAQGQHGGRRPYWTQ